MTTAYVCPARYWPSECAAILLGGLLAGEVGEVHRLLGELTDRECAVLLPVLLALSGSGLALLDEQTREVWWSLQRASLAGLPRDP